MKIFRQKIIKSQLDKIPENERNFFIFIGHLTNEILILQKLFSCFNKASASNAEERAQNAQALFINSAGQEGVGENGLRPAVIVQPGLGLIGQEV